MVAVMNVQEERNPYGIETNHKGLEHLLNKGVIDTTLYHDMRVQSWVNSTSNLEDISKCVDINNYLRGLSFYEKVASSLCLLRYVLEEDSRAKPHHRYNFVTTSLDGQIKTGIKGLIHKMEDSTVEIKANPQIRPHSSIAPYHVIIDLEKQRTSIKGKYLSEKQLQPLEEVFDQQNPKDMLAPLSLVRAFPLYNVENITMYCGDEGVEYTPEGKKFF